MTGADSVRYWSDNGGHEKTALGEGYEAYGQGFSKADNPYPKYSDTAKRWLRGYDIAAGRSRRSGGAA